MRKRIFQHNEGEIKEFSGSEFSTVKGFVNSAVNSVVVLWLYDENKNIWYRLFNDGAYCGVDQYAEDESGQDLDDDIRVVDYSGWFRGKPVLSAPVFIETNEPCDLNVLLNFGASACKMVYHRAGQICSIRLVDACF